MYVLVKLKMKPDENIINKLKESHIHIEYVLTMQPIICIKVDDLEILNSFDFIEYYELDENFEVQKMNILPNVRVNKLKSNNYFGNNISVAVLDSGMDDNLVDVSKSVVFSNSVNGKDARPKGRLHGTVVGRVIKYIAPWSKIINLKVACDDGSIPKRAILKALEWAYLNKTRIINMSLGKPSKCNDKCMVCNAVNQMCDEGFVIVAAIGNYGEKGKGITGCPGNAEKALTVGAVDSNKNLAGYSSTAPEGVKKPNILAPGYVTIKGDLPHTGTSFSAPFATGVIAALAQTYDPLKIREAIETTARSIGLKANEEGNGVINIEGLLEVLKNERSINQS
ncbi:S8 family serine peptidase [Proteiniborus sp.]|uniref:S8 family peptidase n=1 Tax=Proteiniborus sp. TaxID=2079015 RepID=UPI00331D7BBE